MYVQIYIYTDIYTYKHTNIHAIQYSTIQCNATRFHTHMQMWFQCLRMCRFEGFDFCRRHRGPCLSYVGLLNMLYKHARCPMCVFTAYVHPCIHIHTYLHQEEHMVICISTLSQQHIKLWLSHMNVVSMLINTYTSMCYAPCVYW
jgi:hypothetical protein